MTQQNDTTEKRDASQELALKLADGEITPGEYVGLTRSMLYAIAQTGYQMLSSGKLDEAKHIYRGLVAASPYDSVFHCHLAAVHHRLGETDEAFEHYTKALDFNIANCDALTGRAEILLAQGKYAEAIADLRRAVEWDPAGVKASATRARVILLTLKEMAESQATLGQQLRTVENRF